MIRCGLIVVLAAVFIGRAGAVEVPWLYEVEAPVASQSAEDRQAAAADALRELLSRVTGIATPDEDLPAVAAALAAPERYVSRYRYERDEATRDLRALFIFDRAAVIDLVKSAGLPLWWSNRPGGRVWLRVDDPSGYRWLTAADDHPAVAAMQRAARRRGLPLALPDEILATGLDRGGPLSSAMVNDVLRAERGSDQALTLIAALGVNGPSQTADLQVWRDGEVTERRIRGADAEAVIGQIVDGLADELAAAFALESGAGQGVRLKVHCVATPGQYAGLLRYLRSLAFVDAMSVLGVQGDVLELGIFTGAPAERLLTLLDGDGRLVRDAPAGLLVDPERVPDGYALRWIGGGSE
jgi:hypothetical protein